MALPRLNESPSYSMEVPSSKQVVQYRPMLVKEQKILMIANESKDKVQMISGMLKTVEACIEGNINARTLPTYDIDYMFTQIRAVSVGETSDIQLPCDECEKFTEVSINIKGINPPQVNKNDIDTLIELTPEIKLKMKHPSYSIVLDGSVKGGDAEELSTADMMNFVIGCMDSIQTETDNISFKDEPLEEKQRFLDSLTTGQFTKLTDYIEKVPKLSQNINFNCEHCSHPNTRLLEGMESFF
jgi:hypothetical protein